MKKWFVRIPYHCDVMIRVEAKSAKQAIKMAEDQCSPSLCHQCSDDIEMGEQNINCKPTAEPDDE